MSSVSPVSSAEYRANFAAQPAAANDDPFALLLDAVTDNGPPPANTAPAPAPRDNDPAPKAKSDPKPDTDGRQARRRADEPEAKPDAEAPAETAAAPAPDSDEEETEETEDTDGAGADAVEILLALTPDAATPATTAQAVPQVSPQTPVVAVQATVGDGAPVPAQAPIAAVADVTAAVPQTIQAQPQAAATAEPLAAANSGNAKPGLEAIVKAQAAVKTEATPNGAAHTDVQAQTQPGTVNVQGAAALHRPLPANLEALNQALTKHLQLQVSADGQWQPEPAQKPALPSNAVMPNFALVTNVANVADVRVQAAAESTRAVPLESLAVEIATRAKNGERRFDIRLDPPELGRIDVRLEIDHKGNTQTKLIVERAETLDLLQRDARGLEKALQSAGLKTDAGGLEFSLRQDAQTHQQGNAPQTGGARGEAAAEAEVTVQSVAANASLHAQLRGGVDIRI